MLFAVSLILATSATFSPVAGATVAPDYSATFRVPASLRIESAIRGAESVPSILAAPPAASDVASWWRSLPANEQSSLITGEPQLVGNLGGVPIAMRDAANRRLLADAISEETGVETASNGRGARLVEQRRLHMLREVQAALTPAAGGAKRHLLSLDTDGYGTAAVAIGDVATSDYVSYLVPGMFFTIDGQIVDWTDSTQVLYDAQRNWLDELGEPGAATAAVAWIGYQTPGLTSVGTLDLAKQAQQALTDELAGLRAARASAEPFVSVVAHSYGSTSAMMALSGPHAPEVDALAMIGSPGGAAQQASDLRVEGNAVFVGAGAAWDPVPGTAFFGADPGSPSFGAHVFTTAAGTDPITKGSLAAAVGHNGYFDAGSQSVRNLALITIGRGDLVTGPGAGVMIADTGRTSISASGR